VGITVTGVVDYLFIVGPKLDEVLPSLYGVWLFTPVKNFSLRGPVAGCA
jgi:putative copper resistance protein D